MAKITYVWERRTLGSDINNYMAKITYVWCLREENLSFINNYMAKVIYVWERRTLVLLIITWLRSPMSERGEP